MFAQGGRCFFCKRTLPKSEASVEHLLASANGGRNNDENCVACCKAINALFGSMSLKEKVRVILNQKGQFKCPYGAGSDEIATTAKAVRKAIVTTKSSDEKLDRVIANLKLRGSTKPRTMKTLTSTITALFPQGLSQSEVTALIRSLEAAGKITVAANKVTYAL